MIRSPICTVVGHVDHGKSSVLDRIRGTSIISKEAGGITQAIGASLIPAETIKKICGELLTTMKIKLTIPGLLFIDTPGHAAFTNLRKRGGNLADIAILVIDIREGIMPQTVESIEILKHYKTPFIIAANKIDLLSGWKKTGEMLLKGIGSQSAATVQALETKMYEIVGKLSEHVLEADRFDRVSDYTKQIAIVPVSAVTGEGIPELLMVLAGLAHKYLEKSLECDTSTFAKGIILEVKEEKGIGKSIDAILYDGCLKVNDTLVIGGLNAPIVTKVRGLFEPAPLSEMRDKKSKFKSVKQVFAATGVKISAPDVEDVVAGMPVMSASKENIEKAKQEVQSQVEEVLTQTEKEGIVVKADSLGSLEAMIQLLKEEKIPIKRASIGGITKGDVGDAAANCESNTLFGVVLGFNVKEPEFQDSRVKIITSEIIYTIIDEYKKWVEEMKKKEESAELLTLVQPCKVMLMKGYIFRQSNPAIIGMEVMGGILHTNTPLMNSEGEGLTTLKSMQADKENIEKAEKGKQVAASLPGVTVGRQIQEGDILLSDIPEVEFRKFKDYKAVLTADQKNVLREIAEIKRRKNVVWGV